MLFAARDFLLRVQTRGELSITAKNVFLPTEQWAPFCARGGTALRSRFWSGRGEKPEVLGQENSAPRRAPRRAARFVAPRPACIRSILQKSKRKQTRTRLRAAAQRRRRWGSGSDPPRFCRPQPRSDARIRRRERPRSPLIPQPRSGRQPRPHKS